MRRRTAVAEGGGRQEAFSTKKHEKKSHSQCDKIKKRKNRHVGAVRCAGEKKESAAKKKRPGEKKGRPREETQKTDRVKEKVLVAVDK